MLILKGELMYVTFNYDIASWEIKRLTKEQLVGISEALTHISHPQEEVLIEISNQFLKDLKETEQSGRILTDTDIANLFECYPHDLYKNIKGYLEDEGFRSTDEEVTKIINYAEEHGLC